MKKFLLVLVFAFILLGGFSFAFSVSAPTQTFTVPTLTSRQVDIVVTTDINNDTITANLIESRPWVAISENQFVVGADKPKTLTVFVSPFIDTPIGLYRITVFFESLKTKALGKADIFVLIQKGEIVNIEKIVVTGDLEPLGSAKVSVHVKNYKTVTVNDAEILANVFSPSKNIGVIQKIISRIDPGEEATAEGVVLFEKYAPAGTYIVNAALKYPDRIMNMNQTFSVVSKPLIQTQRDRASLLFGSKRTITVTNYGNQPGDETVVEYLSPSDRMFFFGDEPASKSEGTYRWVLTNIQPGGTRTVTYNVDYSAIFLLLIAIIIAVWFYFTKMRTIRVRKYILQKKKIEEGEEFTVAVEVKNASGRASDVDVYDFVPSVFTVKDAQGVKPEKKKSHGGTELAWKIKDLKNREERLLTYKVSPIFGISGTIKLPRASAVFEVRGKKLEQKSFAYSIGLPEEKREDHLSRLMKRRK